MPLSCVARHPAMLGADREEQGVSPRHFAATPATESYLHLRVSEEITPLTHRPQRKRAGRCGFRAVAFPQESGVPLFSISVSFISIYIVTPKEKRPRGTRSGSGGAGLLLLFWGTFDGAVGTENAAVACLWRYASG